MAEGKGYGAMKGTSGQSRGGKGAEKTVVSKAETDSGGGPEVVSKAGALYRSAVANKGAGDGDQALRDR